MTLPNFLVLGVAKAGTTSLYHYLGQHPEIGMSQISEPRYLIQAGGQLASDIPRPIHIRIASLEDYHAQYAHVANRKARGDISPHYFVYPTLAVLGIRRVVPDGKIITIFRQPADRGYSNYLMCVRRGGEPIQTFAHALDAEREGIPFPNRRKRHYFAWGFYAERVQLFLNAFPQNQFLFLLYDDLVRNPQALLRQVFEFLEVDPNFQPNVGIRHNAGSWPNHFTIHRAVKSLRPLQRQIGRIVPDSMRRAAAEWFQARNSRTPPKLDTVLRRELTDAYREDILRLQDIIQRDLSAWLRDPE
jgi:hypothetical protein